MKVIEVLPRKLLTPSWVEGFKLDDLEEDELETVRGSKIALDILDELGLEQMEEE